MHCMEETPKIAKEKECTYNVAQKNAKKQYLSISIYCRLIIYRTQLVS